MAGRCATLRTAPVLCAVIALGCEQASEAEPTETSSSAAVPLAGLSPAALARFQAGAHDFSDTETAAQGLGPLFNASACAQCHNVPLPGGAGLMRVTRASCPGERADQPSIVHVFSTRPDLGAASVPADCTPVVTERRTTSLRGAGLIEAIPDAAFEALAAQQPRALAGRPAYVLDAASGRERVGRFGWKAQHATLDSVAGESYRNELGITNELFPEELAPNGDASLLAAMDPTPDPEAAPGTIRRLADFMRWSAAPVASSDAEGYAAGSAAFAAIGCQDCHAASYVTESADAVLDGKVVPLYSDLLLHDVGTGDGIAQADAGDNELRTAPLWGVRHAQLWLHDGRATSLDQAVRMHAGQAEPARQRYEQLEPEERAAVIAFMNSL
jgi:CxxC motif-containing protein (DUF1111 family)